MKPKIALVFGFSEKCYPMAKQMVASWCRNVLDQKDFQVDLYPYMCNFLIKNINYITAQEDHSAIPNKKWYEYKDFTVVPNFDKDFFFWKGKIFPQKCTTNSFRKSMLPDISVYQSFADEFIEKYDYVIYAHSDIKFKESNNILNDIIEILNYNTLYSIIASPTVNADIHISFRFITYLNIVNTSKFVEQRLSYINDMLLMNPYIYHVYGNGGNALFASFYSKINNPFNKYKPHRNKDWIEHLVHTEFRFVLEDAAKTLAQGEENEQIKRNVINDAKIAYIRIKNAEKYYNKFCEEYKR